MRKILVLLAAFALAATPTSGQEERLEFSAVALSAGGPVSNPVAAQLLITVDRPSTAAERDQFLAALTQSQEAALEVLKRLPPVGSARTPGSLRWAMRYAQIEPRDDGGRDIILVTDRPMSFAEAVEQPITTRYPFTVIQLHVNASGAGEGSLHQAVSIRPLHREKPIIGLENYTVAPVRLTQVKREK